MRIVFFALYISIVAPATNCATVSAPAPAPTQAIAPPSEPEVNLADAWEPPKQEVDRSGLVVHRAQRADREEAARASFEIASKVVADGDKHSIELKEADRCVLESERQRIAAPCLGAAERLAQRDGNLSARARIAYVRAMAEKNVDRSRALLTQAEKICEAPACAPIRRKALKKLSQLAAASKNVTAVLQYALRDMQVYAATLEPEQRLWARSPEVMKACRRYAAENKLSSCRKFELQLTGTLTYFDYSRQSAGQLLPQAMVREVGEHYSPMLEKCLTDHGRRLPPNDVERIELRWVVSNEGLVTEAYVQKSLADSPLIQCIRAQFADWRYPKFTGERQNIEQTFTVTGPRNSPR